MVGRLEWFGHEIIVAAPNFAPMYVTRTPTIKTDRRDACALAEAWRVGVYRAAHRVSDAQRHVRARLTVRDALMRTRTGCIAVIRALPWQHGWRVLTGTALGFISRVLALTRPGRMLSELAPRLAVIRQVNESWQHKPTRHPMAVQVPALRHPRPRTARSLRRPTGTYRLA